jgi:hypothetical protein
MAPASIGEIKRKGAPPAFVRTFYALVRRRADFENVADAVDEKTFTVSMWR